ncbi:response regulator transcription factor [Sulfitobacter sp. LCG007]
MHAMGCRTEPRALSSVLIVDDHPLYCDALTATLQRAFDRCDVLTATSLSETLAILDGGFEPDLVMLDLKLPDVTGISGFEQLRQRVRGTSILVISSLASHELVRELLDRGAMGFLPKESPASVLREAVQEVIEGRRYVPPAYRSIASGAGQRDEPCAYRSNPQLAALTPQQKRILKLISEGNPNKLIAYELDLAETTVKAHITALLRRLGVTNRTQAAVLVESMTAQAGNTPEVRAFLKN